MMAQWIVTSPLSGNYLQVYQHVIKWGIISKWFMNMAFIESISKSCFNAETQQLHVSMFTLYQTTNTWKKLSPSVLQASCPHASFRQEGFLSWCFHSWKCFKYFKWSKCMHLSMYHDETHESLEDVSLALTLCFSLGFFHSASLILSISLSVFLFLFCNSLSWSETRQMVRIHCSQCLRNAIPPS